MDTQEGNTIPEIWKAIPDWPGYEVSDQGRVRSYRLAGQRGKLADEPQLILRPSLSAGYPRVCLCKDGETSRIRVHVLVLLTFRGPCPPGLECCHNDGIPTNIFLTNLRWDTPSSNQRDRRRHGTVNAPCGETHVRAKLTEADVLKIRELYAQGGHTHKMLADQFEVKTSNICNIVAGKDWKHLPCPPVSDETYAKIKESHRSAPPKHFGAKHPNAKLTDDKVLAIRLLHSQGHSYAGIGRMFGVTKQAVRSIVLRKSWPHIA